MKMYKIDMVKDPQIVINAARVLAPIISSRDVIDLLKERVLKADTKSVVLDFRNVEFISRSAAHELLVIQEELRRKNRELDFINTNKDVAEMLRVVAANRALPKSEKPQFTPERTDINTLREELVV